MKLNWVRYNRASGQDLLEMLKRIERAYRIIELNKDRPIIFEKDGNTTDHISKEQKKIFEVKSSTIADKLYEVDAENKTCSCPDFNFRFIKCKHLLAVEIASSPPSKQEAYSSSMTN